MIVSRGLGRGGGTLVGFGLGRVLRAVPDVAVSTVSFTVTRAQRAWEVGGEIRTWTLHAAARGWKLGSRLANLVVDRLIRLWRLK